MSQTKQEPGKAVDSCLLDMGRKAGVILHFTSLPGPQGCGDIADAATAFIDLLGEMSIGVWQFLPTGPTAYGDSPYQPLSAFAGNPLLIGLDPLVRLGLLQPSEIAALPSLPEAYVDYSQVIPARHAVLRRAAEVFHARRFPGLRTAYEEFLHRHGDNWLHDYALFRLLKTLHAERAWPHWDKPYRQRDPAALHTIEAKHLEVLRLIRFTQFLFAHQWHSLGQYAKERGIRLFGDMPMYLALDSADAWAHPEMLLLDVNGRPSSVSGVPPDYFSDKGQLWGNPLYDWAYHARTGYRWWLDRMRHASQQASLVRVDHFRGFESFWSVPVGARTARSGSWQPGPGDALFAAMEQALGRLPIVAEDLGVITPEVEALRLRHGIPGMKVLQFEVSDPDFDLGDIDKNCVCYTGTHDNDTTLGWFHGGQDDTRSEKDVLETRANALRLTGGTAQTMHLDMIRLAFSSPASLAIAPMQDYLGLGSQARLNIPGTTLNNWRWRLRPEDLPSGLPQQVAALIDGAGRARTPP